MNEYIPIKEFADKVGVSTQAIYQRIEKDLQSYLKIENGKKTLSIRALELFNTRPVEKEVDNELYKTLQETLKSFKEQLEAKDQQLKAKDLLIAQQRNDYNKQLEAKDLQIERLQKSNEASQSFHIGSRPSSFRRWLMTFALRSSDTVNCSRACG